MNYENTPDPGTPLSTIKLRVLLYTAVFFVIYSIYTYDSFSTWKFLAIFLPLAFSFPSYNKIWIFLPIVVLIWFGFMVISVGTIYNHDLLELTGPLVCPEGYTAEVKVFVETPVPGETYTYARMRCVNKLGNTINPGYSPQFLLLGLYLIPALILFFINIIYFKIVSPIKTNKYFLYLSGSALYCFLAYLLWKNQEQIILAVKKIFS